MGKKYLSEIICVTKSRSINDFTEWLLHHLSLGVQHIHIFDNESDVNIKHICENFPQVSYEIVTGWPNQYALYDEYLNGKTESWWTLPIDDDEFLWLDPSKYKSVNHLIFTLSTQYPDIHKLCIGWLNIFPYCYTKTRTMSILKTCNAWSHTASNIWQQGNRPVKSLLHNIFKWSHLADNKSHGHNPTSIPTQIPGYTITGESLIGNYQKEPTSILSPVKILHAQFRSDDEWQYKCTHRVSAAGHWNKNHPELYKQLYSFANTFHRLTL